MEEMVPLISSSVTGPLGIAHLPRLWLKILLHSYGRLAAGYRHGGGGFDEFLCTRLAIDRDAMVAFIETEKPDYLALERWVSAHAGDLTPGTINAFNMHIRSKEINEALAGERRARFALADEQSAGAVFLNDLDDWAGLHEQLATTAAADTPEGRPLDGANKTG